MKQIETLVFDYGGVIVNIDDASVVKAMESLGVTAFKRLIHVRKIKRLMHQYINGLVAEAETLKEMLSLCRKGTTTEDIEKVLEELCGNLPVERLEALVKLRKRYKVYLLSNINDTLWQKSISLMNQLGYSTDELFDEVFLSYAMRKEKPSVEIYEEMTQQTGNRKLTLVALRRSRSCHRLFHRKSGSCMYHHRHSLCDTDIQDWSALPMAFWCYSKRNE